MSAATLQAERLQNLSEEQLRRLLLLSHEFNASLDPAELLPRILDLVIEAFHAEAGAIWVREGDALRCEVSQGEIGDQLLGVELPLGAGIVGDVVERNAPARVEDAALDERYLPQVDELTGFRTGSVLAVPLVAKGEVIGAVEVSNRRGDGETFTDEQFAFLLALADDAAAGIKNARLFEAEKRARDLRALLEVSHEITATFDLDRVLLSIVNLAGKAVRFERCAIALRDEGDLRVRAISGEATVDRRAAAVRELEGFLVWAAEWREALAVPDTADPEDEHAAQVRERFGKYLEEAHVGAFLCLPIRDAEGDLGVLHFEFAEPTVLAGWTREAAQLLTNEAALAIRNAQLYAGVPFISWLEPLADKRRALASLPGSTWLRYGAIALAVVLALTILRWPLRVSAQDAGVRAAVQTPARATVDGIVESVWVREGETVSAGATLAELRNERLGEQFMDAEARLAQARHAERVAEASGNAAAAALARVEIDARAEALRLLEAERQRLRVVSPAAGVVLTPRLEERVGSYIPAGAPLAWVGNPDWAEVELRVSQQDAALVQPGQRLRAKVPAHPGVVFEGQVLAVSPAADPEANPPTVTVRAMLDNREGLLRPGMTPRAKIVTASQPLGALIFRRPLRWIRMHFWW